MVCQRPVITLVFAVFFGIRFTGPVWGGDESRALRSPKYPLKTQRLIFTADDVRIAHENVRRYPQAKAIADKIVRRASEWLDWPDEKLLACIATPDVPRAFNVSTAGCPTCGKAIYAKGGTYPWKLDLPRPFQVECPVCEGRFPDNDFASYYRSQFQEKQFLAGAYADDGWGWVGPGGERYWFVCRQHDLQPSHRDDRRGSSSNM